MMTHLVVVPLNALRHITLLVLSYYNHGLPTFAIEHHFILVHHSQTNNQVEAPNKMILFGLKKKVNVLIGCWVEELDNILWALRMILK